MDAKKYLKTYQPKIYQKLKISMLLEQAAAIMQDYLKKSKDVKF